MRLLEFLADHTGIQLETRRDDPCLQAALITFGDGRRLIIVERTYRDGIIGLLDPTSENISTFREGDLWEIWNSGRGADLSVI